MKLFNCLIIGAFLFAYNLHAQDKPQTRYNIVVVGFYNLENFYDTINDPLKNDEDFLPNGSFHYTSEVYLDKVSKLSDIISLIGSDVSPDGLAFMGCAEIENETVLKDLINTPKLKDRHYKIIHYDSPDERGIDVGFIYNPKYFTPTYSEKLFVAIFNPDGTPHPTRDVLYIEGKLLNEPVFILVNHWPSRGGGEEASAINRAAAAAVCKHKIDSLEKSNPDAKIIVMGDLNDDPVSKSVSQVLGAKGDIKDVKPGGMYNPWVSYYKRGIGTLAYNDAWNLFDQVLISSAWLNNNQQGLFFKEADIFHKPWMIQEKGHFKGYPKRTYDGNKYMGGYSDHFPTYIILLKAMR